MIRKKAQSKFEIGQVVFCPDPYNNQKFRATTIQTIFITETTKKNGTDVKILYDTTQGRFEEKQLCVDKNQIIANIERQKVKAVEELEKSWDSVLSAIKKTSLKKSTRMAK